MTDPAGGPPAPQGSGNWQTPPPPAPGGFQPGGFQPAPVAAGPAPGVAYADLTNRIIAAVIDGVILWVVWAVVAGVVLSGIALSGGFGMLLIVGVVLGVIWAVGTAAYFVYTWTTMRASPGQKILKLETVNAGDGATLTRDQAIKRWAFLFGPTAAATVLSNVIGLVGTLLSLAALGYIIFLVYTISKDSRRQGFHDVQASTVVVKRLA